jgi:sulfonate transport system substrate-binding protein
MSLLLRTKISSLSRSIIKLKKKVGIVIMKNPKIVWPLLLLLLLLVLVVNGCGSQSAVTAGNGDKVDITKVTLHVGETGWPDLETGFKAAGVSDTPYKVAYSLFQGGNMQIEAMGSGNLDIATGSEIPPIFASQAANGGNFKIIAVREKTTLQQELVIPKDSTIKSVADLRGKKVGYVNATTSHYFLKKMLEQAGLTWNDITPVPLSTSDGLAALVGGNIDALASYGNAIISAHQNGATELASAKDILSGNYPIESTPEAINDPAKHAAILDYLVRLNKFHAWARENPEKWAEIVSAHTHQPIAEALAEFKEGETQKPSLILAVSDKAIAAEQDVADTFSQMGLLKTKIDVKSFWSDAFTEEIKQNIQH